MTTRSIILTLCAGLIIMTGFSLQKKQKSPKAPQPKKAAVSYTKDVLPILHRYCLPCHTEDEMNPSQLYLDTYEDMMRGGKHGPPVVPGKPDSSNMIRKVSFTPPFGDPMPLKRKIPFPADTLAILKAWIQQGAKKD